MSIYLPYPGQLPTLKKKLKREGIRGIEFDKLAMQTNTLHLGLGDYVSATNTVLETLHYGLSHKVYYIPSIFADNLLRTKNNIDISMFQPTLSSEIFELCFEDTYSIGNIRNPSCLVSIPLTGAFKDSLERYFSRMGDLCEKLTGKIMDGSFREWSFQASNVLSARFSIRHGTNKGNFEMSVPSDTKDVDKHVENILSNAKNLGIYTATKDYKALIRIVMGLIFYLHTKDPDILKVKCNNRPAVGQVPDVEMVGGSIKIFRQGWHIRHGHWRYLESERWTKKRHQFVWVRPFEVHKEDRALNPPAREEFLVGDLDNE